VRTGKPRWQFRVIPRPGEVGNETWENDSWAYTGHANLWSQIGVDEDQGFAYLPLTSPTNDMFGGHRLGDNLFSSTPVCVTCLTGERVWHYQITHHDLSDYDRRRRRFCGPYGQRKTDQGVIRLHGRARSHNRRTGLADRRAAGATV
jgi:glucose dehydrogenase